MNSRKLRVGLFGIGLDTYWPQFKGLKPRLEGYVRAMQKKLERPGVEGHHLRHRHDRSHAHRLDATAVAEARPASWVIETITDVTSRASAARAARP